MEKYQFKTNIKCSGCVEKVEPRLNAVQGIRHWEVDLSAPEKWLTVEAEGLAPELINSAMQAAGYKAELIKKEELQ